MKAPLVSDKALGESPIGYDGAPFVRELHFVLHHTNIILGKHI